MQSIKILFVEDNIHDAELLARHIEKNEFKVHYDVVESLKELEYQLKNETYDICICDFKLPNFSGLDALKVIGKINEDLPVILVSGAVHNDEVVEVLLAGAKDCVLKDNLTRLVPAIKRELAALEQRRERDKTDQLLNAVFESPSGVRISDEERFIIEVNQAYCQMMGYTKEELIGKNLDEIIPENRILSDRQEFYNFINDDKPKDFIHEGISKRDIRKDGTYIDVFVKSKVIKDIDGKKYSVCTFQDESEVFKYKTLFEESGRIAKLGGWEYNVSTGKEKWTDQIYQIFGVSADEFDPSIENFKHFYVKGSLEKSDKAMRDALKGESFDLELQLKDAKGVFKWCRATGNPIFENDEVVKIIGSIQDITETKKIELEVRESQRNYKFLFEKSPNPMLIFGKESQKVLYSNTAAEKMYGYSKAEFSMLKSDSIFQCTSDFDKSLSKNNELTDEITSTLNVKHITKSGESLVVNIFTRMLEMSGNMAGIFVINDVTEKNRYEHELIKTNNLLKALIERAPIGVITVNEQGFVDDIWNPQSEQIFGWSRREVLGRRLPYVSRDKMSEFHHNLQKGAQEQESFITEIQRVRRNGEVVYLKEFVTPIIDGVSKTNKVMLLVEDITEKKEVENALINSEQKYRNLVEASHDIIWRMDKAGVFTFMNNAIETILGYSPEDLIGKSFQKYINPEKLEETIEVHSKVNAGDIMENFPLQMMTSKGDTRYLDATAYPIRDKDGTIMGCSGTATDITHLKEYQSQLEESLEEKEILIREIHHRVKNNLAIISGLFALQSFRVDDEKMLSVLKESQSRIKSIAKIHEKLYQHDRFSSIEMKEYLSDLVKDISDTYMRSDRDVTMEIAGDDVYLNVNQAVPFGILANELIINAYKYAFEFKEKGMISLLLNRKDEMFKFTVKDDGVGLPTDFDIDKLDSLGMILVRTLAQQLDAEFTWTSKAEKGVAFNLEFKPSSISKSTWIKKTR